MIAVSSLKAMEVMDTQVNRWLTVRGSWQSSHCRETSRSFDPQKKWIELSATRRNVHWWLALPPRSTARPSSTTGVSEPERHLLDFVSSAPHLPHSLLHLERSIAVGCGVRRRPIQSEEVWQMHRLIWLQTSATDDAVAAIRQHDAVMEASCDVDHYAQLPRRHSA